MGSNPTPAASSLLQLYPRLGVRLLLLRQRHGLGQQPLRQRKALAVVLDTRAASEHDRRATLGRADVQHRGATGSGCSAFARHMRDDTPPRAVCQQSVSPRRTLSSEGATVHAQLCCILQESPGDLVGDGGGTVMSGAETVAATPDIGSRVRMLRRGAGMTQGELADGRFTKQYVSQIERGEVTPEGELLDWLAERLDVEPLYLETGYGASDLDRVRRTLEQGDHLLLDHVYSDAAEVFRDLRTSLPPGAPNWVVLRAVNGEGQALIRLGRLDEAGALLDEAQATAVGASWSSGERSELAYLTGILENQRAQIASALAEFSRALDLLNEAGEPNDRLRIDIYQWRTRCYRRLRDWEAAREDIERALELCRATDDVRRTAEVLFQASIVSYRLGSWLQARRQAESARDLFAEVGDTVSGARMLNNLANLNELLGNADVAIDQHKDAFRIFLDAGLEAEAGYVLSSLAEIHRGRGELEEAERAASRALEILGSRKDHVQEVVNAQLVLARTRLEQGELDQAERLLGAVDESFANADSISHRAQSWMARGELELLRENAADAARLYRQAATALQPAET